MVVLDSSFLVAYYNSRDVHHAPGVRAMVQLLAGTWGPALLLEHVFIEVVTVLMARRGPEMAIAVADSLIEAREVTFVPCSDQFLAALDVFRGQSGHRLSFVDAAVVAVARHRASGLVLTFDADLGAVDGIIQLPE